MAYLSTVNQIVKERGFPDIERQRGLELVKDTERLIKEIVERANRIRKHRFGQMLTVNDINESLTAVHMDPLLGFHNSYPVYNYVPIGQTNENNILAYNEPQIPLSEVLCLDFCPTYPDQVYFTFHWLSYEGVQPKIPENLTEFPNFSKRPFSGSLEQTELPDQAIQHLNSNVPIPEQLIQLFKKSVADISPKEFDDIIRNALQISSAIQPLVPLYLRYFIANLQKPLKDRFPPEKIYKIVLALLFNPNIDINPHIQNFTSIALTLLMSVKVDDSTSIIRIANLLVQIVTRYKNKEFTNKLAENLADLVLSKDSSLPNKVAGMVALRSFGVEMLKIHFIPYAAIFIDGLKSRKVDKFDADAKQQIQRLLELAYEVSVSALNAEKRPLSAEMQQLYTSIAQKFGYNNFYLFAPC